MSDVNPDGTAARFGFFSVDWRCAEEASRHGVNVGLAYLALAKFTGRNHRNTIAGVTALHTRLGLSRGRADLAMRTLQRVGLLSTPTKGTLKSLMSWAEVLASQGKLTPRQQQVFGRVLRKGEGTIISGSDPDYQIAYTLANKGLLELTDAKVGKPRFRPLPPERVWLPNTLVDGFGNGDSPLARLRGVQDPRAIPLLLDCYRHANLAEDGGLPRQAMRQNWKRTKVREHGLFTVWGFVGDGKAASWDPLFTRFRTKRGNDEDSKDLWAVWGALEAAGLIEIVSHIVEGSSPDAQVLHPYALPLEGEEVERAVREAAHQAGRAMVSSTALKRAEEELGRPAWLCPVRSYVIDAQLVGIARPVHRPHTRMTAAWAANFLHQCAGHTALFDALSESAAKSAA